jgi:UDP-N-acetylmuramoyl-L-alanyl-D-glutamate--2,6-diaminopimelate ligase
VSPGAGEAAVKLSRLIAGLPVAGDPAPDPEIEGVACDSRRVAAGDLFVAWRGARFDAALFAADAVARGAVAVLAGGEPGPEPGIGAAGGRPAAGVPWLTAADPHALLAPLAARAYGHPDRELVLAGVTGTNGKSTVAALLARILEAAGRPAGLIGTLGSSFRDLDERLGRTTPEASDFFRLLRRMRDAGAEAVAMEVSSHALVLGRVAGARFDLAVFTNLTRDHFDFHAGFEDYFAAKRSLFSMLKEGGASAVNVDDPYGRRLAAELPAAVTFGAEGAVRVARADLGVGGTAGELATPRGRFAFASPLVGRFNLDNLLAAAAGGVALDLPLEAIAAGLAAQPPLPGRMEPVDRGQPFPVIVDYAHTPAALEAALRSLAELGGAEGRREVIVVFGCGGDRDPGKRPLMGRIAGELADVVIATSDNPRTEDPLAILAMVEQGLAESGHPRYEVVPDRRAAIRRAVELAGARSAILIAGKGAEAVQMIGTGSVPFYDRDEAAAALAGAGWRGR